MKKKKILYIEDDCEFAKLIKKYLEMSGFDVEHVSDSVDAVKMIEESEYDLVLSDLNLEKLNGNQVVEIVKKYNPLIKVALFTCSQDQFDELIALKTGADEYIRKESSYEVLVERLKKMINDDKVADYVYQLESEVEKIVLNVRDRVVTKDGEVVKLTKLEFDILKYFLENKNKLLSRKGIYENIWHVPLQSSEVDLRNIDSHIKNLRRKLNISSVISIRGVGYKWYE